MSFVSCTSVLCTYPHSAVTRDSANPPEAALLAPSRVSLGIAVNMPDTYELVTTKARLQEGEAAADGCTSSGEGGNDNRKPTIARNNKH